MKKVELLAPAGDYECFVAAINASADAVYLSGNKFGARAYAKNFECDELIKAIDYAHVFGRKVYLTLNTLLKDSEMIELFDFVLPLYEAGLDGVIVQDMGVISYLKKVFPELEVHASTQLAITSIEGIRLLEKEGVKRTVLARELSLNEINTIHEQSDMELETFVHGALCYSYSGKCLFSSLIGGRSGNRGRCAGPCRQPYNDGKFLLSTKDICCLAILPKLIESGIASLKIEGRMKSPEYVAGVTSIYRKYIDLYYEKAKHYTTEEIMTKYFSGKQFMKDLDVLTRLYTRGGNSEGYYFKHNGKDMISIKDASYISDKGDVKESISMGVINEMKKISLFAKVYIHPGEDISININGEHTFYGVKALFAEKRPLDVDSVCKQLNKTKDTEFEFSDVQYDISDNAFVRVSDLNELRRNALDSYREYLIKGYRRQYSSETKNKAVLVKAYINEYQENDIWDIKLTDVCCDVCTIRQFEAALEAEVVNRIYTPLNVLKKYIENTGCEINSESINELKRNKQIFLKFPSVIRNNYFQNIKNSISRLLEISDGAIVDSHETFQFLKESGYNKTIVGDIHIYALNTESADKYIKLGFDRLTVPVELNKKEIMRRQVKPEELIVYGRLPMMISAQCINNTINGCDKKTKTIPLVDRKGAVFTAVNSCEECSNTIYNSVPVSLHDEFDFIEKLKPSGIRMIFTTENYEETKALINGYGNLILHNNATDEIISVLGNKFTKGHLNRGVL